MTSLTPTEVSISWTTWKVPGQKSSQHERCKIIFMNYSFGNHTTKMFAARLRQLGMEKFPEFGKIGKFTFFIPVDAAFEVSFPHSFKYYHVICEVTCVCRICSRCTWTRRWCGRTWCRDTCSSPGPGGSGRSQAASGFYTLHQPAHPSSEHCPCVIVENIYLISSVKV